MCFIADIRKSREWSRTWQKVVMACLLIVNRGVLGNCFNDKAIIKVNFADHFMTFEDFRSEDN